MMPQGMFPGPSLRVSLKMQPIELGFPARLVMAGQKREAALLPGHDGKRVIFRQSESA
jgi:hypothetical protein